MVLYIMISWTDAVVIDALWDIMCHAISKKVLAKINRLISDQFSAEIFSSIPTEESDTILIENGK